ncbi:unnamed protein product [Arctogadus glacialis]
MIFYSDIIGQMLPPVVFEVYDCLLDFKIMDHRPTFPDASGLAYQIMDDLKTVQCSDEGRELYKILQSPHIQALLSSHDSIARLDYEPVLPPLPEELPGDQDAMRIVCLVKNNQPLFLKNGEQRSSLGDGRLLHSPVERLVLGRWVWCGEELETEEGRPVHRPHPKELQPFLPYYSSPGSCHSCQQTNAFWEQVLNPSALPVYNSAPRTGKERFDWSVRHQFILDP